MNLFRILVMVTFPIMTITAFSQEKAGRKDTTNHPSFYTCPRHSDIKSEKAGYCSICGMKLELTSKEKMKREVTKSYTCPIHTDVLLKEPGKCPQCGKDLALSPKEKMKREVVGKYTCSMHTDVTSKTPGKCPKCNMDLVEKKKKDHSDHHKVLTDLGLTKMYMSKSSVLMMGKQFETGIPDSGSLKLVIYLIS